MSSNIYYCRLKAYCNYFWGRKNQSFRNKSGKAQPIRTKFGIRGHVKGWQRSWNFGRDRYILGKMGSGTSPAEREFFFCLVNHATYRQLRNGRFSPNLVTKRISVSRRGIRKDSFENFHFMGHLPPPAPNLKSKIGQTGTSLRAGWSRDALQRYRGLLFTPRCSPRAREFPVNFSVRCTVAELRGVKFAHFSDFGLFSPYKTPKTYLIRTDVLSHQISSLLPPKWPPKPHCGGPFNATYYIDKTP